MKTFEQLQIDGLITQRNSLLTALEAIDAKSKIWVSNEAAETLGLLARTAIQKVKGN